MVNSSQAPLTGKKKSLVAGITVAAVLGLYLLLHPFLERKLGMRLPNPLKQQEAREQEHGPGGSDPDRDKSPAPQEPLAKKSNKASPAGRNSGTKNQTNKTPPRKKTSEKKPSDRGKATGTKVAKSNGKSTTKKSAKFVLREAGNRVLVSPAGLRYGPGSREGHRLTHVLRHAKDDPSRPIHGVFDGERDQILTVIDEAYRLGRQRGRQVKVETSGQRKIYTVDLRRRIGFIGGQSGKRNNHPAAKGLRLVLEDKNVITAFPVKP